MKKLFLFGALLVILAVAFTPDTSNPIYATDSPSVVTDASRYYISLEGKAGTHFSIEINDGENRVRVMKSGMLPDTITLTINDLPCTVRKVAADDSLLVVVVRDGRNTRVMRKMITAPNGAITIDADQLKNASSKRYASN